MKKKPVSNMKAKPSHAQADETMNPDVVIKQAASVLPKYRELFKVFFKIGLFTFGGGFAMIPLIHREMTEKRGWVADGDIVDVLALAQTVPGAVAINAATLIGKRLRGNPGGLAATVGVILPSFTLITVIAAFFSQFQNEPLVQSAFHGLRPAVVALMATAVWKVGKTSVRDAMGWILALLSMTLVVFFNVHVLFVILGSALTGAFLYLVHPHECKPDCTGGPE